MAAGAEAGAEAGTEAATEAATGREAAEEAATATQAATEAATGPELDPVHAEVQGLEAEASAEAEPEAKAPAASEQESKAQPSPVRPPLSRRRSATEGFDAGLRMPVRLVTFRPGRLGIVCAGPTVTRIGDGSQAAELGVKVGWRVLSINGDDVPQDITTAAIGKLVRSEGAKGDIAVRFDASEAAAGPWADS